jgi:hypothetical protein
LWIFDMSEVSKGWVLHWKRGVTAVSVSQR